MSRENVQLHHRAHDAFNRRDLDAFLALMDEDIEFIPNDLILGRSGEDMIGGQLGDDDLDGGTDDDLIVDLDGINRRYGTDRVRTNAESTVADNCEDVRRVH
jgi:hypothetical protein